jgi:hypothetical protein
MRDPTPSRSVRKAPAPPKSATRDHISQAGGRGDPSAVLTGIAPVATNPMNAPAA